MTNLKELVEQLNQEELITLLHGYDHYLLACQERSTPLSMAEYHQSDLYQDFLDSDEFMEFEFELAEASIEEVKKLAMVFDQHAKESIEKNLDYFDSLDHFITELEIGYHVTEDDRERLERFENDLLQYGYLPTENGDLVHLSEEEKADNNFNQFIWDDYKMACELVNRYPEKVHVCTLTDGGRYLYISEGWHYVNRMGYILASQPLLNKNEDVIW